MEKPTTITLTEAPAAPRFYIVPEANLGTLTGALAKLQKRAVKLGQVLEFVVTHERDEVSEGPKVSGALFGDAHLLVPPAGVVTRYHRVTIVGEAPRFAGWRFVATLQTTDAGTIIRSVSGAAVPEAYRTATNACDHCKSDRRRIDTYLVLNTEGVYKQVGRTCLKDFLGHADPHALAAWAEMLAMAGELGEASERDEAGGGYGPSHYALAYLLPAVSACIRAAGWISRGKARDSYTPVQATADYAFNQRHNPKLERCDRLPILPQDEEDAAAALERAAGLHGKEGLSDYESNIAIVAASGVYDRRSLGIAASILPSWKRVVQREAELKLRQATSAHVGTVGAKLETVVTLVGLLEMPGDWGMRCLYRFVDASGNLIIWWTKELDLKISVAYALKGTVKKHTDYQGAAQTEMTRCKVRDLDPAPEARADGAECEAVAA